MAPRMKKYNGGSIQTMNTQQAQFKHRVSISLMVLALVIAILSLTSTIPLHAQSAEGVNAAHTVELSVQDAERQKWGLLSAAIAFGFGAIGAGMAIAKVGSAAMGAMSERPEVGSQALIFVAMAEGIVIFGFISALMILGKF